MPYSEQENEIAGALMAQQCTKGAAAMPPPPAFRFAPPSAFSVIDWHALNSVDLPSVVRDTDVDALESVLDIVVYGDLEGEDWRTLTPANFIQLFRTAQLTLSYLLHVQDRLAADSSTAKGELGRAQQRLQVLGLRVEELKEELAGSRKEVKHLKKAMRTFETLALARQQPPPPPEVRVVERAVEVPDVAATRRLEAQVEQLERERAELQRENGRLTESLGAAQAASVASAAQAAAAARQEERQAAEGQVQAAVEAERRKQQLRDSKTPKVSVMVSDNNSPDLRGRLSAMQRRAEAAEEEAVRVAAAASKAAAKPVAEAQRLRAELEAAAAESDMLRSQLAARQRERSRSRSPGHLPAGRGLASALEDVDDARMQQLEAQVETLQAKLSAAEAAHRQLAQRCRQLEQQLQEARRQGGPGSESRGVPGGLAGDVEAAEVLQQEVERLRGEKAAVKEECRRLRQQAAQDSAEIDHLTSRLHRVADSRAASRSPSPTKAGRADGPGRMQHSSLAGGRSSPLRHAQQEPQQQHSAAAAPRGMGSPIEDAVAGGTPTAAPRQPNSTPPAAPVAAAARSPGGSPGRRPGGSPVGARSRLQGEGQSPATAGLIAAGPRGYPTVADQQQFRREQQFTLHTAERPGVVSRFPHSLASFLTLRGELQPELEAELSEGMQSYSITAGADRLSDRQLGAAMAELEQRRATARQAMSAEDRQRYDYMRATATWHVERMGELVSGQRSASPALQPLLSPPPSGLRPIRTLSRDRELPSPRHRGFVEQVLDQVGDEAAVYSPLGRGASHFSEHGYPLPGDGAGTPRSIASPAGGPLVSDGGTPRSPWSVTHARVFQAGFEMEGRRSPLGDSLRASPHAAAMGPQHDPWQAGSSAAASPVRQFARDTRGVQFGEKQWADMGGGSNGQGFAPVQRMGRRASDNCTQDAAQPAARRLWKEG